MYEELRRKKVKLEEELKRIIQQKGELEKELELTCKALEDKVKEIDNVLNQMEEAIKQQKSEKAEAAEARRKQTAQKEEDLLEVILSKPFYKSVRKYMPEPHWKKLTKAIHSDEFFTFILKNSYANRVIKACKNDTELNQAIMERIVFKLRTLIK